MVGGVCVVGSSIVDSHTSPCLRLDSLASSNLNHASNGDLDLQRKPVTKKLSSSFMDSRFPAKAIASKKKQKRVKGFVIVSELGGQYDDNFHDVKAQIFQSFHLQSSKDCYESTLLDESNTVSMVLRFCCNKQAKLRKTLPSGPPKGKT